MEQLRLPVNAFHSLQPVFDGTVPDTSKKTIASTSREPRHVCFNSPANSVHPITPYAEIYGAHPRTFNFDRAGNQVSADMFGFYSNIDDFHIDEDYVDADLDLGPSREHEMSFCRRVWVTYRSTLLGHVSERIGSLTAMCTSLWVPLKALVNSSASGHPFGDRHDMWRTSAWQLPVHRMSTHMEVDQQHFAWMQPRGNDNLHMSEWQLP